MRIPRIHISEPLAPDTELRAPQPSSHYLLNVLRLGPGAPLILFDGRGGEYGAQLLGNAGKQALIRIGVFDPINRCSPLSVCLGIGVSRGERMNLVVQKATELGVTRIAPLFSARTEVRLDSARAQKKLEHWRGIAISACEQCGRNLLPEIGLPTPLDQWLVTTEAALKLVMHPGNAEFELAKPIPASLALLVGPEGGLSDREVDQAQRHGFCNLSLGPRILRTETAPLAALAIVQYLWGDMGSLD